MTCIDLETNITKVDFSGLIKLNTGGDASFCNISNACMHETFSQINTQVWGRNILFLWAVVFYGTTQLIVDLMHKYKLVKRFYNIYLPLYLINYAAGLITVAWGIMLVTSIR